MPKLNENGGFLTTDRAAAEDHMVASFRNLLDRIPPALISFSNRENRIHVENAAEVARCALHEFESFR